MSFHYSEQSSLEIPGFGLFFDSTPDQSNVLMELIHMHFLK